MAVHSVHPRGRRSAILGLLLVYGTALPAATPAASVRTGCGYRVVGVQTTLNVRVEPYPGVRVVGRLTSGARVSGGCGRLWSVTGRWVHLRRPLDGYAAAAYLRRAR